MAFVSLSEYMEQRRKEIHGEASDDHWLTDSVVDPHCMYPYHRPWHVADAPGGVVSSMVEQ